MKAFDSLIRLHRWQADEKRRQLADLEAMREDLLIRRSTLDAEIQAEQSMGEENVVQFSYAAYVRGALQRRETLGRSIAEIERAIEAKQDEVAEAVRELKKFEIAASRRAARRRQEENRRDQAASDEIALAVHRRSGQF